LAISLSYITPLSPRPQLAAATGAAAAVVRARLRAVSARLGSDVLQRVQVRLRRQGQRRTAEGAGET
jgi:hypothetical protein